MPLTFLRMQPSRGDYYGCSPVPGTHDFFGSLPLNLVSIDCSQYDDDATLRQTKVRDKVVFDCFRNGDNGGTSIQRLDQPFKDQVFEPPAQIRDRGKVIVYRKNWPRRGQGVNKVCLSHKADHTVRPL